MDEGLVLASDAGVRGVLSGYLVILPFLAGCAMGAVARRGGTTGRVLAIALPTIVLAVVSLEYAKGSATTAEVWGGALAAVVYAIAAGYPRRASRTGRIRGLLSCVVGVALLLLVGGGATPSVTDAVLLATGTVLLLGPFLIPRSHAVSPERGELV